MIHPAIRDLLQGLNRNSAFQELARRVQAEPLASLSLSGLTTTAKALYLTLLWQATERPLVVVVDGNKQLEVLGELVETFFELLIPDGRPLSIPALDVIPNQRLSPHNEITEKRAIGLWRLATRRVPLTMTPVASALLRTEPPEFYRQLALPLRVGDEVALEDVTRHLESIGYERREPVELVGEYSVRGGILDVFPAEAQKPVRIEFFGDLIESMRRFDVETQRSVLKTEDVVLLPLAETPRSRTTLLELATLYDGRDIVPGEMFPGWEFLVPLVRPRESSLFAAVENPLIVWDEPEAAKGAAERLWKRLEDPERTSPVPAEKVFYRWEELAARVEGKGRLELRELDLLGSGLSMTTRPSMSFRGNMGVAVAEARNLADAGNRVLFFAASTGELERLADIFQEYRVPYQLALDSSAGTPEYLAQRAYLSGAVASTYLVKGRVRRGVVFPEAGVAIIGSEDLFDTSDLVMRQPGPSASRMAAFAADLADLKPGDYIVHTTHGVGKFLGLRELDQGDGKAEFMLLEYAGDAKLYVPLARMDLVQKYRGAGDAAPPLDRLGGATWQKTKSRVKAKMRDMADELLKLYAQRKMAEGFRFSPDGNWQREFEDAFEFAPTKDQLAAVQDIKRDMESMQPMDRLLCGDVGFGKTEVAMRAAFKALGDGKQVAVLAPTTVLTLQHFETFKRRFAPFPVRVEMFSRFQSAKELKKGLEELSEGKIDIAVGTHRLLSQDVEFHDLGLLIVDEEQRFGVKHKERLKQLRHNVDVLTMSATPIPRTLHMALLGIRDMSVIETPPKDRLAIQTVVSHFDANVVRAAIEQEISRGGQVYFVHNRIETIWERAAMVQELVPQARIGVGHGQMGESALEKVLLGFMKHEFDVFVSTTIVENGLDIPLANTIIIDNAERYGLSELYQLRGRVGRSNRRAYAYLLVPQDAQLSDIARKRLAALKEFSDLGAGFKIAALDLELRGAGNLLGGEQHGHIAAVGFDMYIRMLEETVHEMKGEEVPLEIHSTLNLGLDIRIPTEYIADEHQRLRAYKRIADIHGEDEAAKLLGELEDRYGTAPEAVRSLVQFSLLKSVAEAAGIELVERRAGALNIKFHEQSKVDPARLMDVVRRTQGAQFTPAGVLKVPAPGVGTAAGPLLEFLRELMDQLAPQAVAR
ncbi:MAG: transcription-repair coupling factor [Bryobacteraceae bacterium]|nr:transcription-repair coupling factor [Bryobacteraceae bacterium]